MDEVFAIVLHASVPVASVESVVLPQLFFTVTTGVAGTANGDACTVAAGLVQPLTVCVTW